MKRLGLLLIVTALVCWPAVSRADVESWDCYDDGDGAVTCTTAWTENEETQEYVLTVLGDQYWAPGHVLGDFTTDTPEDPTIIFQNVMDNNTDFDWTGYIVNLSLNQPFTLTDLTVDPADWTSTITAGPTWDGTLATAQITYTAGTPVAIGETLSFGYKMALSGSLSYSLMQEMIPVPEPSTFVLGLGALVGLLLVRRRLG